MTSTKWGKSHDKIRKFIFPEHNISVLPNLPNDIISWINVARPLVEGRPRTFLTIPFWLQIYLDSHNSKMIVGGRQIYKSTYITDVLAFNATSARNVQVGYVTYDQPNLTGFARQKLQIGTFSTNLILSQFPRTKTGNIGEISLKNDSTIYCMTDHNQYKHIEGKSLNHCILDEAQYQDIENLPKIRQAMMATKGSLTVCGIGGEQGSAYEQLWNQTDQREWIYDNKNWRDLLQFDSRGLIIDTYLKSALRGKWIIKKPENTLWHGYHLPQTIFATIPLSIEDAIHKYHVDPSYSLEYQQKNYTSSFYQSHSQGSFYKAQNRPITPEMVKNCMKEYRYLSLHSANEISMWKDTMKDDIKVSMGVDFGSGKTSDTVICILIHWRKSDRIQLAYLDKRPSENQMDQAELICNLFKNSLCDIGIGDLGYAANQIKIIQDGGANRLSGALFEGVTNNKFFGCRTVDDKSNPLQIHHEKIDEHGDQSGRISIDKTRSIQKLIDLFDVYSTHPTNNSIKRTRFMIPLNPNKEYETDWLIDDLCSITRKTIETMDSRQNAKLEFNHPPDSAMAIIYALIGLEYGAEWNWVSM